MSSTRCSARAARRSPCSAIRSRRTGETRSKRRLGNGQRGRDSHQRGHDHEERHRHAHRPSSTRVDPSRARAALPGRAPHRLAHGPTITHNASTHNASPSPPAPPIPASTGPRPSRRRPDVRSHLRAGRARQQGRGVAQRADRGSATALRRRTGRPPRPSGPSNPARSRRPAGMVGVIDSIRRAASVSQCLVGPVDVGEQQQRFRPQPRRRAARWPGPCRPRPRPPATTPLVTSHGDPTATDTDDDHARGHEPCDARQLLDLHRFGRGHEATVTGRLSRRPMGLLGRSKAGSSGSTRVRVSTATTSRSAIALSRANTRA